MNFFFFLTKIHITENQLAAVEGIEELNKFTLAGLLYLSKTGKIRLPKGTKFL